MGSESRKLGGAQAERLCGTNYSGLAPPCRLTDEETGGSGLNLPQVSGLSAKERQG